MFSEKCRSILSISFVVCSLSWAADSIDVSECQVAGIELNDSAGRVRELIGNPVESGPECDGCIDIMDSWYRYDGLKIHFVGDQVFELNVTSSEFKLLSGLGVGARRKEVEDYYGIPTIRPGNDGDTLIYDVTFDQGRSSRLKLYFRVQQELVSAFKISLRGET